MVDGDHSGGGQGGGGGDAGGLRFAGVGLVVGGSLQGRSRDVGSVGILMSVVVVVVEVAIMVVIAVILIVVDNRDVGVTELVFVVLGGCDYCYHGYWSP